MVVCSVDVGPLVHVCEALPSHQQRVRGYAGWNLKAVAGKLLVDDCGHRAPALHHIRSTRPPPSFVLLRVDEPVTEDPGVQQVDNSEQELVEASSAVTRIRRITLVIGISSARYHRMRRMVDVALCS
uniref:Uncharacterized protein n=1 Tax=Zea mays TaxID=4577 RepID=B6SQ93_MAIZE|nr:hypothetical protein [Zea mays]